MTREQMAEMLSVRGNAANNTTESNETVATVKTKAGDQTVMTGPGFPDWSKLNKQANRPTKKMMETIKRNCEWKGVQMDESRCQTFDDAYAYIGELFALPFPERQAPATPTFKPATPAQIAKIRELCEQNGTELPDFSKLDGNYNGTASQFIQEQMQIAKEQKTGLNVPLTDKQKEEVIRYQICPAVTAHQADGKPLTDEEIDAMSKQEAGQYIAEHRSEYYEWIKERLSMPQLELIENLQKRMGNPPLGYEVLIQFDKKQASAYITQLSSELERKEWLETTLEPEDDYLNDEVRHRKDKSPEKVLADLRNMAAKLYAVCDMAPEDTEGFQLEDYKELVEMAVEYAGERTVSNIIEDNYSLPEEARDYLMEAVIGF